MLALSASLSAASAEIELRGGPRIQAPIQLDSATIAIRIGRRDFRLPRGEVRVIDPGGLPLDEWPSRRDAALRGTSRAKFAAGWWALENGLTSQAEAIFRHTHAQDPTFPSTARLAEVSERLSRACSRPELSRLDSSLGVQLERSESDHIVLLHRLRADDAADRLELMERVLRTFYLTFAGAGFDLRMPREKQVSICFPSENAYTEYLRSADAGELVATRGYYHPTLRIIVTFDESRAQTALSERQELLAERDRQRIDLGTVAHELIHQLVAESGLAPRYDSFPIWLHEGLAMQFETVRDGRWTGVGQVNDTRLAHWRTCRSLPRLAPLLQDVGFRHGYDSDHYAQAWAFVSFLRAKHPAAFTSLLDVARLPESLEPPQRADRYTSAMLQAAACDLPALEDSWRRYVRTLHSPEVSTPTMNP